jgi:hypothetical protein
LIFEISKGSGWGRQMAGWQSRKVSGFMAKTARNGKKMGAKNGRAYPQVLDYIRGVYPAVTRGYPRLAAVGRGYMADGTLLR